MSETLYVSMEFDAKQMIRILGNDLYDSPLAMLRENVQNAYDAILERKQVDSAFEPVIKIDISDTQIIIEDNGIGMNDDILTNNYWKAGNSGKNNAQALAAGVVGHFGIGALANFGVCTKLEIQTHRFGENKSFESEALRDKLNVKESIPIVTRNGNNIPVGTRVVATLECRGSINADSAINYLRQYIQYIEIPVYVNGMKFPKKTTSFERKISGLQITSSAYSYKLDIGYGNSFPLQVYIKAYDINIYGTRLKGYIFLNSSEKSLMGLRNGFGLSNINVLSAYDFGGVANLDCLVPTAGREAVSRESTQLVYSLLQSIEKTGINLSLWKNLSTQRTDTVGSTFFNLGIFSAMNRLNGLGVNVLGAVTGRDMNGIQISGISNMVGGSMRGVQVAGITNINGNNLSGLSVSGLVGITGNHARGMVFSGLANITGDNSNGMIVGGLLNITGEKTAGVQLSGLANISGGNFSGVTISGLLNVVGDDMKGLQISGLGNITGGTSAGVQLSPLNVAVRAKGLQIGLVNYYKEKLDGFQLGLVNANPDTKVQMMFFGGNTTKLNLAARFKNKLFYTILGGGTHFLDFSDKFSGALFYRAGLELPVCKQLFISGDLGYQHVETFKNKDYGFPARLYSLQTRINLEYRLTAKLGVFVTGGYGWDRYYNRNANFDKGAIVEGGVVLFKY